MPDARLVDHGPVYEFIGEYEDARDLRELLYVDGTHFFDEESNRFPVGFLPDVLGHFKGLGLDVETPVSLVEVPRITGSCLDGVDLRDYQVDAVQSALDQRRGVIKVPTGGGKTVIGASILAHLDCPAIFYVPTVPLLRQAKVRFEEYGLGPVGTVGDGGVEHLDAKIVVADVRMMNRHLSTPAIRECLDSREAIVVDECHHAGAKSWVRVLLADSCKTRIGLSATPYRDHGEHIRDLYVRGLLGDIIYTVDVEVLKAAGVLANPNVYRVVFNGHSVKPTPQPGWPDWQKKKAWHKIYENGVVTYEPRNERIVEICVMTKRIWGHNTVVLVTRIEHGILLLNRLREVGLSGAFMTGGGRNFFQKGEDIWEEERADTEIVSEFSEGKWDILLASPVMGEGYDLPGDLVQSLIVATAGRGNIPVLQRLGRAMRPKPGGEKVFVFDFGDHHHPWLKSQSNKRFDIYEEEGHDVFGWGVFLQKTQRL